jgi:1,4-alpha-glucan branching enzyme/maltooligosyltrehalose trehalohydrolase
MNGAAFGARLTANGTQFHLWAPAAQQVDVMLNGTAHAMARGDDGRFATEIAGVAAGARYRLRIDDAREVPDPASAFQPHGIAGPSEVIDHAAFRWRTEGWRGRPWAETVLIETHVGTFTPQGSYRAMIDKLDQLAATGITAIELMPVAEFAGRRGWGYDGVLWYAPTHNYGRPDDLKVLIDAAHDRGLMVLLDVVYNHFGPEGNYLGQYAPQFFSNAQTPWGNAIDYGVPEVRAFAIANALHWLRDYRFDGLRLDAVHAIVDAGEPTLLRDLSHAVGKLAAQTGRHIHLVLENDDNIATLLDPDTDPSQGRYRAQWNDDYHHAWHALLTGERHGYYGDYAEAPLRHLATTLHSGFAYQGEASLHRDGRSRGQSSGMLPPIAFVNFLQNHDQIGNRALGERLESLAPVKAIEAALAITLLAPAIPMLFMGEEWGATTPFPYFCDFTGDLAAAVRRGRRQEFAGAYAEYGDEVPDPLAAATLQSARLDWTTRDSDAGAKRLALVQRLLDIRHREIVPRLAGARFAKSGNAVDGLLRASWRLGDGALLRLTANLSEQAVAYQPHVASSTLLWGDDDMTSLAPWSVLWHMETP